MSKITNPRPIFNDYVLFYRQQMRKRKATDHLEGMHDKKVKLDSQDGEIAELKQDLRKKDFELKACFERIKDLENLVAVHAETLRKILKR